MSIATTTHINFRGNAREALEHYRTIFGGNTTLATYADIGAVEEPGQADQIAFGQLSAPNGFRLMGYDVQPSKPFDAGQNAFYVTLNGTDEAELKGFWDALADGATVLQPLGPAPFSPLYGMLTDRLGVTWIVGVAG